MFIVSGSLPKSGATWMYNMANAALVAAGHDDMYQLRKRFGLSRIVSERAGEISYPGPSVMAKLLVPHTLGHTVWVRTHLPPSRTMRTLLRAGIVKASYLYRDPRDVALSAFDHGQRSRSRGTTHHLGQLLTIEDAIRYTQDELLPQWEQWTSCPNVVHLRYEQLIADPAQTLADLFEGFNLSVPGDVIEQTVKQFDKSSLDFKQRDNLLINKACAGRFNEEMNASQLGLARDCFGPYLQRMGYAA